MSFKTFLAVVITVLLTVTIMQNQDTATFNVAFIPMSVPKLVMLTGMSVGGFLLGILVSRPRRKAQQTHFDNEENTYHQERRTDTLSDEDREYIS